MAFDQATRNRLQKFVSDARKLLSEEFTQQLQNTYGLDPINGGVSDMSDLPSLSPSEQQTATLLRDTLDHYLAASGKVNPHLDKALIVAALDRIVREQAFTVLNRLAALRMAEARQFVMESISEGYQSKGFQLYQRIAGSSLGETGQAYQTYLFSIFDELSLDLTVLFDRYSAQGRLFPRETVLIELLELINHAELGLLWVEDETVGWIYQFWNGRDEIDKMRAASRAPRNSREMAVRNQFFTPRYVVEFLTDNTLGRTWYEMTKGKTSLVDSCQYLVRRPNEVFLDKNQTAPAENNDDDANFSQDELLQKTVIISHRALKDPRDIRMLDPACGSMHFGLYAFDLFETIYSEAWDFEADLDDEHALIQEAPTERKSLHDSYASKEDFLADVPRLIIEHNIHGVDIDPRAAQIAGLSLWLRAQKSWSDNDIKPVNRPQIQRSNIVCAEPMPGEKELLKDFTSQIQPRVLGQLVEEIFEKMELAGEAGTLLKIEEEIQSAIEEAKAQKDENVLEVQGGLFGDNQWEVREGKRYYNFGDVTEDFWEEAEKLILQQLERYAEASIGIGSGQKRLFAADTVKGFAFIDLCRKRFDVVLMNPPFGDSSKNTKHYIDETYFRSKTNLLACFLERGHEISTSRGKVGAIVSRTGFYLSTLDEFRQETLLKSSRLECHVDLGSKVLDATVEVACSIFSKENDILPCTPFIRLLTDQEKESTLLEEISKLNIGGKGSKTFLIEQSQLLALNGSPFVYWINSHIASTLSSFKELDPEAASIRVGLQTGADFRFLRLWWEVSEDSIAVIRGDDVNIQAEYIAKTRNDATWCFYSKIDKASPFIAPIHLVVNWARNGREIKAFHEMNGDSPSRYVRSESSYFLPGICYMLRSSRLIPYIVPNGVIPTAGRSQIYPLKGFEEEVLAIVSSNIGSSVARFKGENFGQPKFQNSMVSSIPYTKIIKDDLSIITESIKTSVRKYTEIYSSDETAIQFNGLSTSYSQIERLDRSSLLGDEVETILANSFELNKKDMQELQLDLLESVNSPKWMQENVEDNVMSENVKSSEINALLSWSVGVSFGRFNIEYCQSNKKEVQVSSPFDPLPNKSPAMLGENETPYFENSGILVSDPEHEFDILKIINDVVERATLNVQVDIDYWLNKKFFPYHLKIYSKSRRQAPIYWPLQTEFGGYTLWIYAPRLNNQTLFSCLNDFIEPKVFSVTERIGLLKNNPIKDANVYDEINEMTNLLAELKNFQDGILEVADMWRPSLSDGIQITAAPLWSFFTHKVWRKKLYSTWIELERGDYEWAKMAYNFWPERVLKKCHQDRSIAIAHDVESELWEEVEVQVGKTKKTKLVWQPKEMTSAELDTYIQQKIAQG